MDGSMFIAQHRASSPGGGHVVGRFRELDEAMRALDARYDLQSWQGIRDETTGQRWWRADGDPAWAMVVPARARHEQSSR